ncbi:hypothetical protein [uncultured Gimesia sp.]|mgnify:CR=1 FL=1|uniref:hypothetical protein n=1 Tax=uncultured Gimesia sp. TaxID=1678688 RepID=UPI00263463CF|nr:hypothetical protein [uncultured Gimesia sp.]
MFHKQASFLCLSSCLLLISYLSGCGISDVDLSADGENQFKVLSATDKKIELESHDTIKNGVSLFIGEKSQGVYGRKKRGGQSSSKAVQKRVTQSVQHRVTLEASDQIKMEDGTVSDGIEFTVSHNIGKQSISMIKYLSIDKDGPDILGQVQIRDAASVVQTGDRVILADIETPYGDLIPISFKFD